MRFLIINISCDYERLAHFTAPFHPASVECSWMYTNLNARYKISYCFLQKFTTHIGVRTNSLEMNVSCMCLLCISYPTLLRTLYSYQLFMNIPISSTSLERAMFDVLAYRPTNPNRAERQIEWYEKTRMLLTVVSECNFEGPTRWVAALADAILRCSI